MATLRMTDMLESMMGAARESLAEDWPRARDYAKPEFKKLAQSLIDITRLAASGKVNGEQARALLRIHRNTTLTVMLTVEGLGVIAVENAINAALKAVRDTVNAVTPFRLL
jgi:hypothetical protein